MPGEEKITFCNPRGQRLVGILHRPSSPPRAAALLCHGMQSSKESEKLMMLGRQLAERGILALRFDFSCSGESEGDRADVTYSAEVEDLRAAWELVLKFAPKKIGLVGSSMGGTVALLFAAAEKNVAALATIAAPLHPERFTEKFLTPDQAREWRERGFIVYNEQRLNVSLLHDVERLDIMGAARAIACPTLVIHGDEDDTVPVAEGRELYGLLNAPKRLLILNGANHRLGEPQLGQAVSAARDWLVEYLL